VGLAARLTLAPDGRCQAARLVFLSVGDGPVETTAATDLLIGELPTEAAFTAAAEAAAGHLEPSSDIHASAEFKRHLARVLTRRCLRQAAQQAIPGRPPA
jgi:CO/xanthine dehydrogenase FAD-binding subunit